jgi:Fe-S-cluster containining protein
VEAISILFCEQSYFFDDGLLFACRRCGACCTGTPGTVYVGPDELDPLAGFLNLSVADLIGRYLYPYKTSYSVREDDQGNCLFFDNGCTIYPVRPLQCSTFPFWFDNMRSQSHWLHIQAQCPGIGHGRRYSKEEIMAIAQRTMMI